MIREILDEIDFEKISRHPNILIAARFWDDERYQAAVTSYKLMRAIDDMIDDRKAESPCRSRTKKRLFLKKYPVGFHILRIFRHLMNLWQ